MLPQLRGHGLYRECQVANEGVHMICKVPCVPPSPPPPPYRPPPAAPTRRRRRRQPRRRRTGAPAPPPSPPPPYRPPPSAPPPAPPFDVNDERTDDVEGAKECFEEAMGDGLTCDHYQALGGGTLQIAQSKEGTTCYYPNDDSVYFDCEETSMQRVCYCE